MNIDEFVARTGFRPTMDYYFDVIEPEYMGSNRNKDTFCRNWKKNGGIQKAYNALKSQMTDEVKRLTEVNEIITDCKNAANYCADHYREERDALRAELERIKATLRAITA